MTVAWTVIDAPSHIIHAPIIDAGLIVVIAFISMYELPLSIEAIAAVKEND